MTVCFFFDGINYMNSKKDMVDSIHFTVDS